jgi:hypothetical protein
MQSPGGLSDAIHFMHKMAEMFPIRRKMLFFQKNE